jgi:hypothetical protein
MLYHTHLIVVVDCVIPDFFKKGDSALADTEKGLKTDAFIAHKPLRGIFRRFL